MFTEWKRFFYLCIFWVGVVVKVLSISKSCYFMSLWQTLRDKNFISILFFGIKCTDKVCHYQLFENELFPTCKQTFMNVDEAYFWKHKTKLNIDSLCQRLVLKLFEHKAYLSWHWHNYFLLVILNFWPSSFLNKHFPKGRFKDLLLKIIFFPCLKDKE
jgi:hypothetical protein